MMKHFSPIWIFIIITALIISSSIPSIAAPEEETTYPIITSSNTIEGWPVGPEIESSAAVVIEASTGTVLYDKNMNEIFYPASITKIMTAILALEHCSLNEMVTFSDNAVFSIPRDSSHIAITPGEKLSVENCLYGLLLASANEVANALAEHISESTGAFAELMNQKAMELGAKNTHFANPSGLPDENHYTSCYDMAMISRAAVNNEVFCRINSTTSYLIPPTNLQSESRPVNTKHKLLLDGYYHYDGCFGGKTGYTVDAGNTLVTFAKRDGMTLICVVMRSSSTATYTDSTALLNYGFSCFQKLNIAANETKYNLRGESFFSQNISIFEENSLDFSLNPESFIVLPIGAVFSDTVSQISFSSDSPDTDSTSLATITYSFHDHYVGSATLDVIYHSEDSFSFTSVSPIEESTAGEEEVSSAPISREHIIKINVWHLLIGFLAVVLLVLGIFAFKITKQQRARYLRIQRYRKRQSLVGRRKHKRKNYPRRKLRL